MVANLMTVNGSLATRHNRRHRDGEEINKPHDGTSPLSKPSRNLRAALRYAEWGWSVLPLHTPVEGGRCSCHKSDCQSIGKHPRNRNGVKDATTDAETIERWWDTWPDANIGVATGTASGLVVLDIDDGGDEGLAALEAEQERLPETVESLTGGGGRHLLFAIEDTAPRNSVKRLAAGVDVRGEGGYIVVPPSAHHSGRLYAWEVSSRPDTIHPAPLPTWLARRMAEDERHGASPSQSGSDGLIPSGQRNSVLASIAGVMRHRGMGESAITAALLADNSERCVPPLSEREVMSIAKSIMRYEPGDTASGPIAAVEVEPQASRKGGRQWPAPLAEAAYHGLAGDIVRAIGPHSEADPVALLTNFLTMFGSAVGDGPYAYGGESRHHANLFVVQVGKTAKARKGTAQAEPLRMLQGADPDWYRHNRASGLSSGEGLINAVRDPIEREEKVKGKDGTTAYETVVVDKGVEDKRLLVVEEEFASVLKNAERNGNNLTAILREAWDGKDLRVLTRNSPLVATGPHISVIGHITETELRRYLTETESANGYANRFVWVCVHRSKVLPEGGRLPDEVRGVLVARLREALAFAQHLDEPLERDGEARALWAEVYPELSEGHIGLFGAVTARAEVQVLRLSLLYALLDQSRIVRAEHLLAALALWEYCEASVRYLFGDATGDPLADRILTALRAEGPMTRTDIIEKLFKRHAKADAIDGALGTLLQARMIVTYQQETAGRPATWYAVA